VYDIDNKTPQVSDDDFLGQIECTLGEVCFHWHLLAYCSGETSAVHSLMSFDGRELQLAYAAVGVSLIPSQNPTPCDS